jgi:type IV pilus assembly protein PilW
MAASCSANQYQGHGQMILRYDTLSRLKKIFPLSGRGNKGFTVIEFLVAFALLAILMAGMIKLFIILNQSYATQNVAASVQQVVRTAIGIMSQNIRMAGFNPLKLTNVGIQSDITQNSIHFSYDLDEDGTVSDEEDIRYFLEDQKLKRQRRQGNRIELIDNVSDLKFTYLDVFDQPTTNPGSVKTVVISMTVTAPAGRQQSLSRTYSTRVICRNQGL